MTKEYKEVIELYRRELEKCFILAQRLDAMNPEVQGAFTGTPSERIERQMLYLYSVTNKNKDKILSDLSSLFYL